MKIRRRLAALLPLALLLFALAGPAAPTATAVTCAVATIGVADQANYQGTAKFGFCADEYPAAGSWCSFERDQLGLCRFPGGVNPDNKISSFYWGGVAQGTRILLYTGYGFAGTRYEIVRPTSGHITNLATGPNNTISSMKSCGTDGCADNY